MSVALSSPMDMASVVMAVKSLMALGRSGSIP